MQGKEDDRCVFLILQFLRERHWNEALHKLEQESMVFFNMKYIEELVIAGEWDEAEKYLSSFTKLEDNRHSTKIFFEIRKQKYFEALYNDDSAKAVQILNKDLEVFSSINKELYNKIALLLIAKDFRQNEQFSWYKDTKSARSNLFLNLKEIISCHPLLCDKLTFPAISLRLEKLVDQGLYRANHLCQNPHTDPDVETPCTGHVCAPAKGTSLPPNIQVAPTCANNQLQHIIYPCPAGKQITLKDAVRNQVRALLNFQPTVISDQTADSGRFLKRMRTAQHDEMSFSAPLLPNIDSQYELPKTFIQKFKQGSNITSMDFHPLSQTLLLVGTVVGDIGLWEVGSEQRIAHESFKIWDALSCPMLIQAEWRNVGTFDISVNRCLWSPDGFTIGVAFSKHVLHTYAYDPNGGLRQQVEIYAHRDGVNDIAFSHYKDNLSIVTCGDDMTIKVWDAITGQKLFVFEGHKAPVSSVCLCWKKNKEFIFSTDVDGTIKMWMHYRAKSVIDFDAPVLGCTTMASSVYGPRFFSCGTSQDGDSFLAEWDIMEGTNIRRYTGFRFSSLGIVQFDMFMNCFLVAGDEHMVKFWDMDNPSLLATTDAEGSLNANPWVKLNKVGSMLAVITNDNGFKILANSKGQCLLKKIESKTFDRSPIPWQNNSMVPVVNAVASISDVFSLIPTAVLEHTDMIPPTNLTSVPAAVENNEGIYGEQQKPDYAKKLVNRDFGSLTQSKTMTSEAAVRNSKGVDDEPQKPVDAGKLIHGSFDASLKILLLPESKTMTIKAPVVNAVSSTSSVSTSTETTLKHPNRVSSEESMNRLDGGAEKPQIADDANKPQITDGVRKPEIAVAAMKPKLAGAKKQKSNKFAHVTESANPNVLQLRESIIASDMAPTINAVISVAPCPIETTSELMTDSVGENGNKGLDIHLQITDNAKKPKTTSLAAADAGPSFIKSMKLPDSVMPSIKVVCLLYTNSGLSVIALASNGIHKLWKWEIEERDPPDMSTANIEPKLWQPKSGIIMKNNTTHSNPEELTACLALSNNDAYLLSSSGGAISLFNLESFKAIATFHAPPPVVTIFALHPQDNNIIAVGMENAYIYIYNIKHNEIVAKLKSHSKKITGLAFSKSLNVLISSGADTMLAMWSIEGWRKMKSKNILAPTGRSIPLIGDTRIQFRKNERDILVVHESQISFYSERLERKKSWCPFRKNLITCAVCSCDDMLVYAGFSHGGLKVFDADTLAVNRVILHSAYISPTTSSVGEIYPLVIAAHPSNPNHIALGMSDGTVYVVEPSNAENKWEKITSQEKKSNLCKVITKRKQR